MGCEMVWGSSKVRQWLRHCLLGLAPIAAALAIDAAHAEEYSPPFASIVVDGSSGAVLQAANPDAPRHPASLTKIMTLYLLFERLAAGTIKLDSPLEVSKHASEQAPTKLGLKPGQTIAVEDAIKAIVTKSANDAAVVVAENLGGDEDHFAELMTQKARALGMARTTYINASGLPDDDQITTARDQALLGRLIQKRFPRYYKYFATKSFVYHGTMLRNHNHLLGSIEGVDGIKTGFTRASGFNLVTSVHRDGHYIVAVVMGGRSSLERDAHMRELISAYIKEPAPKRAVSAIAKSNQPRETQPALAYAPPALKGAPIDPIQSLSVKTSSLHATPVQSVSLAPMPVLAPAAASAPRASAQVAARWLPARPDDVPVTAPTVIEKNTLPLSHDDSTVPNQPRLVKTISFHARPVQSVSLAPMPVLTPAAAPQPSAQVAARRLPARPDDVPMTTPASTVIEKNTLSPGDSTVPNQPRSVKTISFHATPVQLVSLAPIPVLVPAPANVPQPSAQVATRWLPQARPDDVPMAALASTVIEKNTLPLSHGDSTVPNQPRSVKTISFHATPVQSVSLAPTPVLPVAATILPPSAQVPTQPAPLANQSRKVVSSAEPTIAPAQAGPTFPEPAKLEPKKIDVTKSVPARVELAKVQTSTPLKSHIAASAPSAPPHTHDGWLIQIGAFDREEEARQHLSTARLKVRNALAAAHPITERVQKGDKVLYRARFTGFDKGTAETACQHLRRSDMDCIALKN